MKFPKMKNYFAAGSVATAVMAIALVPFNMGGCGGGGAGNMDIGGLIQGGTKMFQSQTLSSKQENAIGQSVAIKASNTYPLYADVDLTRYVTLVTRTVSAASPASEYKFYVAVLDTDEVNAFSAPCGYVFLTRGAIKRMQDESELAGVLAHEVGHVAKQHGLNAVKNANFWDGAVTTAAASEQHIAAFKGAVGSATDLVLVNGYSRAQEDEADAEAVKYTAAAGYDPNGFVRFLTRLQQEQKGGPKLFPTHPGMADRIKLISAAIAKAGTGRSGATLADRFTASVSLK